MVRMQPSIFFAMRLLQNSIRLRSVRSPLSLPCDAVAVGCEAVAADDNDSVAGPVDLDERHVLLVEPGQHIEGDASATVQHDDPRRKVRVALEVAVAFLLLRIVGEAVADEERPCFDPERDAMAGQD